MKFETVIGLEIHVQLKTKTKMFCRCLNAGGNEPPNTCVCPVCLGQPGSLPVINEKAVEFGAMVAHALGGKVTWESKFDRKQYFYPDLPKGYQISQFDLPIVTGGAVKVSVPVEGGKRREISVRIHRAHLEEDAAKLIHADDGNSSFVDFNRGGTPLIEIVTEPDMRSPAEAKAFLQELRLIMRTVGVSDADMEKGHLRCDANVSIREEGTTILNPKTEVKNINSFRSVERALDFEIKRQTKLALDGKPVVILTTRGWDDVRGITVEQRTKEDAADYRYFPEPDLPPLMLQNLAESLRSKIPELPEARRNRFQSEYGFSESDSRTFVDDEALADFAERVMTELQEWVSAKSEGGAHWNASRDTFAKLAAGWILTKLNGIMTERKIDIRILKIKPEDFAELLAMLHKKEVTGPNAYLILEEMAETGADPSIIMEEKNLGVDENTDELALIAAEIIVNNPKALEDWRSGKTNAAQFLVGQMMKATRGKAQPETARQLIEAELKKMR